jgi:hypothetical protein
MRVNCIWKYYEKKVSSDGQQFHQYQQKMNHHLSPQTIKHKKTIKYGIRIPGPGMGQAQKGGRVEPVNEICIHY